MRCSAALSSTRTPRREVRRTRLGGRSLQEWLSRIATVRVRRRRRIRWVDGHHRRARWRVGHEDRVARRASGGRAVVCGDDVEVASIPSAKAHTGDSRFGKGEFPVDISFRRDPEDATGPISGDPHAAGFVDTKSIRSPRRQSGEDPTVDTAIALDIMGDDMGVQAVAVIEHATVRGEADAVRERDVTVKDGRLALGIHAIERAGCSLRLLAERIKEEASCVYPAEGVGKHVIEAGHVVRTEDRTRLSAVNVTEVPPRNDDASILVKQDSTDALASWHDGLDLAVGCSAIYAAESGIAEEESVEADEADYNAEIALIAQQSDQPERRVRARLEKQGQMDALRNQIIERKVIEMIVEAANVTEEKVDQASDSDSNEFAVYHSVIASNEEANIPEAKYEDNTPAGADKDSDKA